MHATLHGGCTNSVRVCIESKLQALVYDSLSSTTAVFSYATEGALFISAQLSSDAVSALRKVPVPLAPKHARKHEAHPPRVKKKSSVSIQTVLVLFELA